ESVSASGRELITAIALAYEVQCRLCDAASIRARGWDHVTYGAFSTALASAKLMKLDAPKTRHAVNIAGVAGAAMRQARVGELSHWKGVAFANAARHGVFSALLARAGMTGPGPIFEGQMGFEKQLGVSLGNLAEKFAVPFAETGDGPASMILHTSIKFWPAEYHSQSAIEAALLLREEIGDPNIVHLDLADGRRLTRRVDYPLGHAKNPLKDLQVEEKFKVLVDPILGSDRARKIIEIVWKLDEAKNVEELIRAMEMAKK